MISKYAESQRFGVLCMPPHKSKRQKPNRSLKKSKRQWLRADDRKAQILTAASQVFIERGLSGARTIELARAAGVNEATIFSYFDSKEALFDAAVIEPLKELVALQHEHSAQFTREEDPKKKNEMAVLVQGEGLETMLKMYPLLVTALFSDKERGEIFYKKNLIPIFASYAKDTMRALSITDRRVAELYALVFFGIHFAVAMDKQFRRTKVDAQFVSRIVAEVFVSGMRGLRLGRNS